MNTLQLIFLGLGLFAFVVALTRIRTLRRRILVPEGCVALLYHRGKFAELLAPGIHVRWGRDFTTAPQDTRKAFMVVAGQEVLAADHVALKVSLALTYQVTDPVKAAHNTQHWHTDLYTAAQLALRAVAAGATVETLLAQRLDVGAQLLARVQPAVADLGLTVHAVEVKDVAFPADLKRAFADVLKAKQEGQAALERARGESAALRNLANAARMLDGNPALMNLRLMQSLASAQTAGSTLVLGVPGGFVPLKQGTGSKPAEAE